MELEQRVVNTLRQLPAEKQQEVLDFVEFLARKSHAPVPRRSIEGIFANLGVSLSAEEIDETRKDAWSGFPRDDI